MNNNFITILIALVAIIYVLYAQYREKAVKGRTYIIMPCIFIFIGYRDISELHGNLVNYFPILIGLCIAFFILGIFSGMFIKFYKKDDGILYQKGGILSVIFILLGLSLREVVRFSLMHTQYSLLSQGALLIFLLLGVQFAGRSLMVLYREPAVWADFQNSRRNKR